MGFLMGFGSCYAGCGLPFSYDAGLFIGPSGTHRVVRQAICRTCGRR